MRTERKYKEISVVVTTGTEGPRHDPYSYTKYEFTTSNNVSVSLHLGLGESLSIDEKEVARGWEEIHEPFKLYAGFELDDFINMVEQPEHYVCKKCGSDNVEHAQGYPGETFIICSECKEIVGSEFNESEIM